MFKLSIFHLEKYPYHAGILINNDRIADLSLLGSKVVNINKFNFKNYETFIFKLNLKNQNKVYSFLNNTITISEFIINKERNQRGWFKTKYSSDFILEIRTKRSRNIQDMNCIEWIIYALEIGDYKIPEDILTASQLFTWSKKNLESINQKIIK